MLQFKINHNIIFTKDKLKKVNLISNDVCHLCEREKHTIKHMMLKCTYVTLFWNEFFAWWEKITNGKIHLPDSVLLYGPVNLSKHNQVLSLALLVTKYFIYKCNLGWGRTRDRSLKCLKIARTILSQNLSETIEMLSFEVALETQSSET